MMELERRDFRAMIYLHYRQGKTAPDSHEILHDVFGDEGPSAATVYRWFGYFKAGRTTLEEDPRPGRPPSAVTPESVEAVRSLIEKDARYTYQQIQDTLEIGAAAVNTILHEHLGVRKLCALDPQSAH